MGVMAILFPKNKKLLNSGNASPSKSLFNYLKLLVKTICYDWKKIRRQLFTPQVKNEVSKLTNQGN